MENILLPSKIEFTELNNPNTGEVVISPCHQGYGTTLGNALRRVLLSSLPGAAVESVKIKGVQHEFSAIEGVQEDVVQVILNLKQLAVRCYSDEHVTLSLSKKGKGDILASDFEKNADVEIMNPDHKIASITDDKLSFEMEITIGKGRGYVAVSEKETSDMGLGTIAIDSLYTPIKDIGYNVEMTRVGDVTNYEKLTLSIETNGTITPKEAVAQATKILMDHFELILNEAENNAPKKESEEKDSADEESTDENEDNEDMKESGDDEEKDTEEKKDEK
ncbi:MAG: DNA-directed RNA polymerase subunit alpha [Candidatus Magasanikbacteria bacterium]|nr:DNA-directed RNA polymerase subunit alpha [Candidatus Magasanikbacteria bacterium]